MTPEKRKRLKAMGWEVADSPKKLLGLTDKEMAEIDRWIEEGKTNSEIRDLIYGKKKP